MNFPLKKISSFLTLVFVQICSFAQDSATEVTTTTSRTSVSEELWYMQKWVWIAGGAAILLILLALFSGGRRNKGRTDRVTITKTVRTDSDVD